MMSVNTVATKDCTDWADKIDSRLGPVSGGDADRLAKFLRRIGSEIERWHVDRTEHDLALHDAISETSRTADELAFWRYQAIHQCACALWSARNNQPPIPESGLLEDLPVWKEAEKMLEGLRIKENQERVEHAEAPRDPGAT